jgi:hypothetical protein
MGQIFYYSYIFALIIFMQKASRPQCFTQSKAISIYDVKSTTVNLYFCLHYRALKWHFWTMLQVC